jgi:hypothetical protein
MIVVAGKVYIRCVRKPLALGYFAFTFFRINEVGLHDLNPGAKPLT